MASIFLLINQFLFNPLTSAQYLVNYVFFNRISLLFYLVFLRTTELVTGSQAQKALIHGRVKASLSGLFPAKKGNATFLRNLSEHPVHCRLLCMVMVLNSADPCVWHKMSAIDTWAPELDHQEMEDDVLVWCVCVCVCVLLTWEKMTSGCSLEF